MAKPSWNFLGWLRGFAPPARRGRRPAVRLLLERLEDRLTPTLITVTTNADAGAGSLRAALAAANNGDVIDFAQGVQFIGLTSGGLTVASDVAVRNDQGAGPVTIDGGNHFTVFTVNKGVTASLSGLTITNGNGSDVGPGGVYNFGTLTISGSTFLGNTAAGDGAGVLNKYGTLTVSDSTFSGNTTQFGAGGGLADYGGTVTVRDSTFSGNRGEGGGGGVENISGLVTLLGDVIVGNMNGDLLDDDVSGTGLDPSSSFNVIGAELTGSLPAGQDNQVNVTVAQAGLAPLGNYGGLTQTFALLPGSVAIGAGQTETGGFDQRGFARPDGAPSDAGAFQSGPLVVNSEADADAPGLLTLRDAVNLADADTTTTAEPITFDPTVFASPRTIALKSGGLVLGGASAPISITGSSAGVTIDGGGSVTVLTVNGVTASLTALTIADGGGSQGGGVLNQGGVLTVADCTFLNNSTPMAGGGLNNHSGSAMVYDCTFSGNVAGAGGAVFNAGTLTISDSTISGNRAGSGGGAFDSAAVRPAAVFVLLGDILVGNTGGGGADDVAGAAFNSSSAFNVIGVDRTGSLTNGVNGNQVGVTVAEVALAPLADNGGPTPTFALLSGSTALGAGLTETTPTYDQRGVARPVGSPGDAGSYQAMYPPSDLTLSVSADEVQEGNPITLSGAFLDGRTDETDTVTIVWDDGSADTIFQLAPGTLTFGAAHTYTTEGDYFPVVFVTNSDGQATAAASEEQVLPSPFSDVVDLKAGPGQTVAGLSVDPFTANVISTTFTMFAGDEGVGEFLAAQLNDVTLPPTQGVLAAVATYDFREHNLGPDDAVEVFLVIHTSPEAKTVPELLYLDPATGQEHLFRGNVLFAAGPNVLFVSILFNNADTPRLVDLTDTVFTVAVAAPATAATTAKTAVSPPVVSSSPGATFAVQTTSFQSTSQLRLTLATTELSQVSQSASSLGANGGGSEAVSGGDDGLAEIVARELEALFEAVADDSTFRLLTQPVENADSPTPHGMAPQAPDADPPQPAAPGPLSFGRMLPLRDVVVGPTPELRDLPGTDPEPTHARRVYPVAPSAAYALAAPLIGAGLVVPLRRGLEQRRRPGAFTSFPGRPAAS